MLLNLENYMDCVCEVRSLNNELLGAGVVSKVSPDDLVLSGASGHKLPLLQYNTQVKVLILSKTSDFMMLVGTVFTSMDERMKITGIVTLQQYERRNFFRVNISVDALMYRDSQSGQPLSEQQLVRKNEAPLMTCNLCDISLGGCLVFADKPLVLGQKFVIEFTLVQVKHKLRMMVCRFAEVEGENGPQMRFGCSFAGNREHQIDAVCKDLFVLQRRMIQRKRGIE